MNPEPSLKLRLLRPEEFTEAGVLAALAREFPATAFRRARLLDSGWDNLAAVVDEDWIFRFPRDADFARDREKAVLDALKGKTVTPIPVLEFWGQGLACMGYRKLPGKTLSREQLLALPLGRIEALAQDLAYFLAQCHLALSVPAAVGLGVERQGFEGLLALAQERLPGRLEPHEAALFERVVQQAQATKEGPDLCFLYNDIHHDNFVVDESWRLSGVYDFGDVAWGDRAADFRRPVEGDPRLFNALCSAYEAFTKRPIDRDKARLWAWLDSLADLAESLEAPESHQHRHAKACLKRYAQELEPS